MTNKRKNLTRSGNPAIRAAALKEHQKKKAELAAQPRTPDLVEDEASPSGYVLPEEKQEDWKPATAPAAVAKKDERSQKIPLLQKLSLLLVFVLGFLGGGYGAHALNLSTARMWLFAGVGSFGSLILFILIMNFIVSRRDDELRREFKKEIMRVIVILAVFAVVVTLFGAGLLSQPTVDNTVDGTGGTGFDFDYRDAPPAEEAPAEE